MVIIQQIAGVAQLAEQEFSKLQVVGSNPIARFTPSSPAIPHAIVPAIDGT
jgi:hypothetical protein